MRRIIAGLVLASILLPVTVTAESSTISRRDGFLIIWNSIRRTVEDNREKSFADVPAGVKGSDEITYAMYRGIIDDDQENFRPDEPLYLSTTVLWLFRTRSVDDLSALTRDNFTALLSKYPLPGVTLSNAFEGLPRVVDHQVTEEEVTLLMHALDDLLMHEVHEVSLYSEKFHGKGTAFGDTFDMNELTAAHRTFPHNTQVKVTNVANGKSVTVRINDRGPYVNGRDMDLSLAAFISIEDRSKGVLHATFQRLGDATLIDQCPSGSGGVIAVRAIRISGKTRLIGGIPNTLSLGYSIMIRSTRPIVLRSVHYPDGTVADQQDWILPGESHEFRPSITGEYVFVIGTKEGNRRDLRMNVVSCQQ